MALHPERFNFYQLVRLLLQDKQLDPNQLDQVVRFKAAMEMAFPGHEVRQLQPGKDPSCDPMQLETTNLVLAGYNGPIPEAMFEQLLDQARQGNQALIQFFDLFNHRLNVLRYRIKSAPRLGLNVLPPEATPVAMMLSALMGLTNTQADQRLPLSQRSLLGLAGLLANPRYSEPVLTRILGRYLGADVSLQPLSGAWRSRQAQQLTRLGQANGSLGQSCRLGHKAWMPAARVALAVAAIGYPHYCRLLPRQDMHTGSGYLPLVALLRFLLNRRHDAWVQLQLAAETRPMPMLTARPWQAFPIPLRLPQHRASQRPGGRYYGKRRRQSQHQQGYWGLRLGQTAWLRGNNQAPQCRFLVAAFEQGEVNP
ncbi:type VI secretion system baseplate subunit TssG [Gallaecimonas mangrovi]|uniref:type VI secretion system baseplate subunit TssG n=1 Tax=Gallaecimonas mangrovi TaxID=2291597 RepID=UPI0018671519|nr:type VI secretion system baseplate subunit TssG [Gallaecimonas mangrovi]